MCPLWLHCITASLFWPLYVYLIGSLFPGANIHLEIQQWLNAFIQWYSKWIHVISMQNMHMQYRCSTCVIILNHYTCITCIWKLGMGWCNKMELHTTNVIALLFSWNEITSVGHWNYFHTSNHHVNRDEMWSMQSLWCNVYESAKKFAKVCQSENLSCTLGIILVWLTIGNSGAI